MSGTTEWGALPQKSVVPRRRRLSQDAANTGWPLQGWTTKEPWPWKVSWKDSPDPRSVRGSILKLLLICGCRSADQQIAGSGAAKVDRW